MDKILTLLKNVKTLSIADFMKEAMFNPLFGYYRTKNPIGRQGDFITAPQISSVFGEMIAAYFLNLILNEKNQKIAFVEMGAGLGTLYFDILNSFRAIKSKLPQTAAIIDQISYNIIEISESLTALQKEKLAKQNFKINWYNNFKTFQENHLDCKIYFVANELFDCFPIHQFVKTNNGWQEKIVTVKDDKLIFALENFNILKSRLVSNLLLQNHIDENDFDEGDIFEHSFDALNFMQDLSKIIKKQQGLALLIDYGYKNINKKNTLQAIKNHQYSDVLENVGQSDLTALVNFKALENCAKNNKLNTSLISQKEFLCALGIKKRQDTLLSRADATLQNQINLAINRLIDEKEMGELFKCLIIWDK